MMKAYLADLWSEKKQALLMSALLVVIVLLGARYVQKAVRGLQSPDVQVLKSVNIQKLTVYKLSFEVITRVSETEEGDVSVPVPIGRIARERS